MDKSQKLEKSRDGVPIWDGSAGSFQEYEEVALLWEQGVATHKRYLCAPRLMQELTGVAKRYVLGKRHDWVSYNGGVERLMQHLRAKLGLPQLPELGELLTKYFKQGRRRRGETMNEYITRKTEIYLRAQQSMSRVLKAYGQEAPRSSRATTRSSGPTASWRPLGTSVPETPPDEEGEEENDSFQDANDPLQEGADPLQHDPWSQWPPGDSGSQRGWWSHDWWQSAHWRSWEPDHQDAEPEVPEILPDMIQGWYLLNDAGLDAGERNMILASIKQDFSYSRIAQELRNQWTDEDLRRKDQSSRHSSLLVDDDEDEDAYEDASAWVTYDDLNEEGMALMTEAQAEAETALAALQQSRRTLREARDKQHQVRMSRKYYKTSFRTSSQPKGGGKGKGQGPCLKCGGDHKTANCPKSSNVTSADHSAPFVCYAEDTKEDCYLGSNEALATGPATGPTLTTSELVAQGKAVIDGGATRTIGSVHALECLKEVNYQQHGSSRVTNVDLGTRPTFGFSTKNQCVSTAAFNIQANGRDGQLAVHALDSGDGPILFSISSLRALGAVVDFAEDLVVFRKITDKKVIALERSSTGHQLLPLATDWYEGAFEAERPIPSLRDFI